MRALFYTKNAFLHLAYAAPKGTQSLHGACSMSICSKYVQAISCRRYASSPLRCNQAHSLNMKENVPFFIYIYIYIYEHTHERQGTT
jgi:hypothetical protein